MHTCPNTPEHGQALLSIPGTPMTAQCKRVMQAIVILKLPVGLWSACEAASVAHIVISCGNSEGARTYCSFHNSRLSCSTCHVGNHASKKEVMYTISEAAALNRPGVKWSPKILSWCRRLIQMLRATQTTRSAHSRAVMTLTLSRVRASRTVHATSVCGRLHRAMHLQTHWSQDPAGMCRSNAVIGTGSTAEPASHIRSTCRVENVRFSGGKLRVRPSRSATSRAQTAYG